MTPLITIVQRSFPPERSASGGYVVDLAKALARLGARIQLVGLPPVDPVEAEEATGFIKIRSRGLTASGAKSIPSRVVALPLMHLALARETAGAGRPHMLVTTSDPPLSAFWASLLARSRGVRHVCWCQDLYPEIAAAAGVLRPEGMLYRLLRAAMRFAHQNAHAVIAVGRCMRERLRPVDSMIVTNWARLPAVEFLPGSRSDRTRSFHLLYSGNLGRVHDFRALIGAAEIAARRNLPHRYTVTGQGPQRPVLADAALRLPNIILKEPVAESNLPRHLSGCDAHLITLGEAFLGYAVPSKLYDAAMSGRPIVFSGPSACEVARALEESNFGLSVPPGDAEGLVKAVEKLRLDRTLSDRLGERARAFASRQSVESAARVFLELAHLPRKNNR